MSAELKYSQLLDYMEAKKEYITGCMARIVRVPSVRGEAAPGAPFGEGCAEALRVAKDMYKENGFASELYPDGGYLLTYIGEGERTIGVYSHADVVPVDDRWIMAQPFSADIIDGFMFGRGSSDNKASIVCSLLAAMALRELYPDMRSRLLMFTGSNEESGMMDIKRYVKEQPLPDVSLVPDSGFPIFRGEKGIMRFWATSRRPFAAVKSFAGGEAYNIVLGQAAAEIDKGSAHPEYFDGDGRFDISESDGTITVTAKGASKHAAAPEGSENAAFMLAKKLKDCPDLPENDRSLFSDIDSLSGFYGEGFGIEHDDPDFGKLTIANGVVRTGDGRVSMSFDIRYGMIDSDELIEKIKIRLDGIGFDFSLISNSRSFCADRNDKTLRLLVDAYNEVSGLPAEEPRLNAGGTYARYLKNAFTLGCSTDRVPPFTLPNGHGLCHQPDEFVPLDGVTEAAAILAYMIYKLDKYGFDK